MKPPLLRRHASWLLAALAISLLGGCSAGKAKSTAEQAVSKFHAQLEAEQYHDIYTQADSAFQDSAKESDITEFLAAVHRKLGKVQNSVEQGFFVNFSTSGTVVRLSYKTSFANGEGMEEFLWRVRNQPQLVNYHIDSRALVTK